MPPSKMVRLITVRMTYPCSLPRWFFLSDARVSLPAPPSPLFPPKQHLPKPPNQPVKTLHSHGLENLIYTLNQSWPSWINFPAPSAGKQTTTFPDSQLPPPLIQLPRRTRFPIWNIQTGYPTSLPAHAAREHKAKVVDNPKPQPVADTTFPDNKHHMQPKPAKIHIHRTSWHMWMKKLKFISLVMARMPAPTHIAFHKTLKPYHAPEQVETG